MKTEVFAHRGSKGTHPENTLAAFREAILVGSDGIELDIHLSKDGEMIVIHDETVDRTTNGIGEVCKLSLAELKALDAGSWFSPIYKDEKIPTLLEVVDLLEELEFHGILNIELKTDHHPYDGLEEKANQLFQHKKIHFKLVYSSFNYSSLVKIKELNPLSEVAVLYAQNGNNVRVLNKKYEISAWHAKFDWVKQKQVFNVEKMPIRVWTVNSHRYMQYCFQKKISAIMTDFPKEALAIRNRWQ